jgi:CheY-like chemotaxis protein
VEDEVFMLMATAEILLDAGFRVIKAKTGDEALQRLLNSAVIDLLLTDVSMPGSINGLDLARRVRLECPHMKIVLMSGYLRDMKDAAVADAFLGKPFPLIAVTDCIDRLLA